VPRPARGGIGRGGELHLEVKMAGRMNCDYCGVELKKYPLFYKVGRFVGEDLVCPVCFNEHFKGSLGKDKARKYDSETMKKI
jgi:hypothetical protein